MKFFSESIRNFIFGGKWRPIETLRFSFYDIKTDIAFNFSVTFYMDANGKRKLEIDGDRASNILMPAQNHPFYHNVCVPFLRKTGNFRDDQTTIHSLGILAEGQKHIAIHQLQELLSENTPIHDMDENNDNIIPFPTNFDPTK